MLIFVERKLAEEVIEQYHAKGQIKAITVLRGAQMYTHIRISLEGCRSIVDKLYRDGIPDDGTDFISVSIGE